MQLGRFHFGYNATEDKGRRQAPKSRVYHEGDLLTQSKRGKLQATAQDQVRNHSLVAWMVRKHLDYVSKFHFSFRTGKETVDALVNRIFRWHGAPRNLDFLGRFGRDEMFRLFEMEKVIGGDAGLIKLADLKLQALEADLIAKGAAAPENVNDSGLVVDDMGRVLQYAICSRGDTGNSYKHHHLEPASNVIFDGYWTRFSSQYRGVSPLSTAINMVQDIHEAFEFNLVKAKMHALFGVALTREADGEGSLGGSSGAANVREWTATAWDWAVNDVCVSSGKVYTCASAHSTTSASVFATDLAAGRWSVDADQSQLDLNPRTVNMLDLAPGQDAKVIESATPSAEFVEGSYLFIQIAMLALDIPITAFDSRRSSFSARIADLNEYEVSSDSKRTKNRYVRKDYSDWVIASIWNDPESAWPLKQVAESAGMRLRDLQESVEWIPSGSPWLDKYKQIQGDQLGIDIALDNAIDACRRRGVDVFDNIDKQAQVIAYAKLKGVPLIMGKSGDRSIEQVVADEVAAANEQEGNTK